MNHIEKFIQTPDEARFWEAKVTMLQLQHPNLSESNMVELLADVVRDEFRARVWVHAMPPTRTAIPSWMVNMLLERLDKIFWIDIAGDLLKKYGIPPTLQPQAEIFTLEPKS
jgi:hypothetical protein